MRVVKTEYGNVNVKIGNTGKVESHLPQGVTGAMLANIRKNPEYIKAIEQTRQEL